MENEIVVNNQVMVREGIDMIPVAQVRRQINAIQEIMKEVMQEGEHYGKIPGCGNKPTLLKAGAEKLGLTFKLRPHFEIKQIDLSGGHREYEIICTLFNINTGVEVGSGVGCCSTMESKYRFRNMNRVCPECGKESIIKGKAEYGGGWLCYKNKGGCGAKWKEGDEAIEGQQVGKIEHDNPADYYNTVLKISKKRAHVDGILTVTAASDIFTQDIEDIADKEISLNVTPPNIPPPQADKALQNNPQKDDLYMTTVNQAPPIITNAKQSAMIKTLHANYKKAGVSDIDYRNYLMVKYAVNTSTLLDEVKLKEAMIYFNPETFDMQKFKEEINKATVIESGAPPNFIQLAIIEMSIGKAFEELTEEEQAQVTRRAHLLADDYDQKAQEGAAKKEAHV